MKELFKSLLKREFSKLKNKKKSEIKRKKISLFTQFFPPDFAATGQLLDELTNKISLNYPVNFEIHTGMPAYAFKKGKKIKKITLENFRLIKRSSVTNLMKKSILGRIINGLLFCFRVTLRILIRFSSRESLSIYTTEPPFLPFFGWFIFKLTRVPYILIIYDIYPDVLVNLGIIKKNKFISKLWEKLNYKSFSRASEIIVLSESMKKKLKKYSIAVEDKISVIPSWSDPEKIYTLAKKDNPFAIRHNITDTFNILYSGNQGRCHDLLTIIGSAIILSKNSKIKFIFIGDGPQNIRIKELVQQFNLKNCIFLPFQGKEILNFSLNTADIALITMNSFSEGLVAPSKLYGHLAASTPVAIVSPENSYLKELVEKYGFGKWFLNGDSYGLSNFIQKLMLNKDFARKFGSNGRRYIINNANPKLIMKKYYFLIQQHLS